MTSSPVRESVVVHGHRRAFVRAGSGPALLLLHGIGNNCQTWAGVIDRLAESHTVIAPDLLGHGDSDKPRGDYSIAAYANGMRDLLSVLDIERATVVGHSLGGGIALQFAYQFPERCERLALVGSGGPGPGAVRRAAGRHAARRRTGAHRADRRLRPAAPGLPGPGAARAARRLAAGARPRRGRRRPARAQGRRGPPGLPPHPARRGRRPRPGGHRARPALPGQRHPDAGHLGQPRPDRARAARRDGARAGADRARRGLPAAPGTGRTSTTPTGSATCCWTSCATTEPAQHDLDSWRRLLAQDQRGVVPAAR